MHRLLHRKKSRTEQSRTEQNKRTAHLPLSACPGRCWRAPLWPRSAPAESGRFPRWATGPAAPISTPGAAHSESRLIGCRVSCCMVGTHRLLGAHLRQRLVDHAHEHSVLRQLRRARADQDEPRARQPRGKRRVGALVQAVDHRQRAVGDKVEAADAAVGLNKAPGQGRTTRRDEMR